MNTENINKPIYEIKYNIRALEHKNNFFAYSDAFLSIMLLVLSILGFLGGLWAYYTGYIPRNNYFAYLFLYFIDILLLLAFFGTWPFTPCIIRIYNDRIEFNELILKLLYRPVRVVYFLDIINIRYYTFPEKKLKIIINRKKGYNLFLEGLTHNKIDKIFYNLNNKGIHIKNNSN